MTRSLLGAILGLILLSQGLAACSDGQAEDARSSTSNDPSKGTGTNESTGGSDPLDTGTPTTGGSTTDTEGEPLTDVEMPDELFFDDLSYSSNTDPALREFGWHVRTGGGGPAMPESSWLAENVEFLSAEGETIVRLHARSDGTAEGTSQGELQTGQRFHEGSFAARVRFTDEPILGPDGDRIVEAFFTITPWSLAGDPSYGELDFEYLSNGGWGYGDHVMWTTTWEQAEPRDNTHDAMPGSHAGWHTLVIVVDDGKVRYEMDGAIVSEHDGTYYPESPMFMDLQIWFMTGGLVAAEEAREYVMDFDWVYFAKDTVLGTAEVESLVDQHRQESLGRKNTIL